MYFQWLISKLIQKNCGYDFYFPDSSSTRVWWHGTTHTKLPTEEYSRERNDDDIGSVEPLVLHQVGDQSDGLNGFTQAHLISQDAIKIVIVQGHHPLQSLDLSGKNPNEEKQACAHGSMLPLFVFQHLN